MRLKPIKWKAAKGMAKKPKSNSKNIFKLDSRFDGLFSYEDVGSFYITNEVPYLRGETKKNAIYLCQSVPYRYGRRIHILRFKTIKDAKKRAQEICLKMVVDKFFVKDKRLSRKVLTEKHK